jgi:hypothetical protein
MVVLYVATSTPPTARAQFNDRLPTNCAGLGVMVKADIDRMRKLQEQARKEEKAPPGDIVSAWQRSFGNEGEGIPSLAELKRIRQHADALNATLRARGCSAINVEKALGGRPAATPKTR